MTAFDRGARRSDSDRAVLRLPTLDSENLPGTRLTREILRVVLLAAGALAVLLAIAAITVTVPVTVAAPGVLEPRSVWPVRSSLAGLVYAINVRMGDTVARGQVIAVLDSSSIGEQMRELYSERRIAQLAVQRQEIEATSDIIRATARVEEARTTSIRTGASLRERLSMMAPGETIESFRRKHEVGRHVGLDLALADLLNAEVQEVEARDQVARLDLGRLAVVDAKAKLTAVNQRLRSLGELRSRLMIVAPANGVVLTDFLHRSEGAIVREGDILLELADINTWSAILTLAERDVHRVSVGDRTKLEIPALARIDGRSLDGVVHSISADPLSSSPTPPVYRMVVTIDDENIEPALQRAFRKGYHIRGRVITRSTKLAVLVREWLFDPNR